MSDATVGSGGAGLRADEVQMRRFLETVFKHCSGIKGWTVLRAFEHEREGRSIANQWVPFGGDVLPAAVESATAVAQRKGESRAVFSPPVAIFGDMRNDKGGMFGGEDNVVCAPAIAVELDARPQESLDALVKVLGEPTLTVASGGQWEGQPKLHAYWRLDEPATTVDSKAALKTARKIATRLVDGDGTAVALSHPMRWPGSWHTKGEPVPCSIIGGNPTRDIKLKWAVEALDAALLDAGLEIDGRGMLARAERKGFKTEREWSAEDLDAAAAVIPNNDLRWDAWNTTGMAFYDASHGSPDGLEAFIRWSEKSEKGDADAAERRWKHYSSSPPTGVSAGKLIHLAREIDPEFSAFRFSAEQWFDYDVLNRADPLFPAESAPNTFEEKAAKFVFEPFYAAAGAALSSAAAPLIKGLLDQGAMSVVYGQSNVGKTFITVDMAYHVATGTPYAGMKTARGHVVYLSAEGGRSITKRLAALCIKHGAGGPVDFHLLRSAVDLRRPDADLKPLAHAIKGLGVPVALIVVDTLSRALAGGDENSSVDMGLIVSNFDKLREFTQAHLMVVHHSGKNQAAGARGHSLLRAATDTEIEVADNVIEAKKQRDLDKDWSSGFVLDVHTLGVDSDGDPVTSCTVRLVDRFGDEAASVAVLTSSEELVASAVSELDAFNENSSDGISVDSLSIFLKDKLGDVSANALRHLLKQLVQKGAVRKVKRGRWQRTDCPENREKSGGKASATSAKDILSFHEVAESGGSSGGRAFE